jgi:carboxymethylenebutenolidase
MSTRGFSRRSFLELSLSTSALLVAACSSSTGAASGPTPGPIPGPGATVSPEDKSMDAGEVDFGQNRDRIIGYRARPKSRGPFPAVLLLHDNRGLTEHMRDVTRRLAKVGYVAMTMDFLSRSGGTDNTGDFTSVSQAMSRLDRTRATGDAKASVTYLEGLDFVQKDRVGVVGFDFGGDIAFLLAEDSSDPKAIVGFYAANPSLNNVNKISAPILAIYPENDTRLSAGIPQLEDAMKKANKVFEYKVYPGTSRGFHNNEGQTFNLDAAQDAWTRTVGFLDRYLKK